MEEDHMATPMEEDHMATPMAMPTTTPTHMEPTIIYMLIPILMVDHSSCMVSQQMSHNKMSR